MKTLVITLILLFATVCLEGKRLGKSRSTSRGSSSKTSYNPAPTSFAQPASAPKPAAKPSLFGWQEHSQSRQSQPKQPTNTQSHSYPSSNTGLSGDGQRKQTSHNQENIQRSNAAQSNSAQQTPSRTASQPQTNNQNSHAYPASNGLSGNSGSGASYPQQQGSGLSGGGVGYPQHQSGGLSNSGAGYPQQGVGHSGAAPPPYSAGHYGQGAPPPYSKSGYPQQQGAGYSGAALPPNSPGNYQNNYGGGYHHPQGPSGYNNGGYGGHGYSPMNTPQMPGYFGNYGSQGRGFGGVGRSGSALTGIGIAGAGIGTVLTGLALWNLARSTGNHRHTVIYDNRGQPVAVAPNNGTEPVVDPILKDLVNCSLTISTDNGTEILGIPCAIATSFTPEADVKESEGNKNSNDNTKCIVTVLTKTGKEYMTTIPCSILLNSAAENNVTEPPLLTDTELNVNGTEDHVINPQSINQPSALTLSGDPNISTPNPNLNCTLEPGAVRDPINPCFAVPGNLTVIPLSTTNAISSDSLTTSASA